MSKGLRRMQHIAVLATLLACVCQYALIGYQFDKFAVKSEVRTTLASLHTPKEAIPEKTTEAFNMSMLFSLEQGSLCPELAAASKFFLKMQPPPTNIVMVQLVGKWKDPVQEQIMKKVFQHNAKMCENTLGIPAIAITEPPSTINKNTLKPAFWKMLAVKETCLTGNYDVVWFLDGDIIITNPHIPPGGYMELSPPFQPELGPFDWIGSFGSQHWNLHDQLQISNSPRFPG